MRRLIWTLLFILGSASAQPYPVKPIRIVVPLVPGGNQDIVARAVAEELSKGLGQQVIVENRPGQSAIIGTQFVKSAPADGYTLLSVAVTFARVPSVVKAAGYDPAADFAGISLVCRIPQVLVVNASHPEVPTLHEQGLTDFEDVTWNGLVAPAGTPRTVLTTLHSAVARALANPELKKKHAERGIEMVASRSPEEFSAYVKSEADGFVKLVREAGIKVE